MSRTRDRIARIGGQKESEYYETGTRIKINHKKVEKVKDDIEKQKRTSSSFLENDKAAMKLKLKGLMDAKRSSREDKKRRLSVDLDHKKAEVSKSVAELLEDEVDRLPNFKKIIDEAEKEIRLPPIVLQYLQIEVKHVQKEEKTSSAPGPSKKIIGRQPTVVVHNLAQVHEEICQYVHILQKVFSVPELKELHRLVEEMQPNTEAHNKMLKIFGEQVFTHPDMRKRKFALEMILECLRRQQKTESEDFTKGLECRYLRLTESTVKHLEEMCRKRGKNPGMHAHMPVLSPKEFVEYVFQKEEAVHMSKIEEVKTPVKPKKMGSDVLRTITPSKHIATKARSTNKPGEPPGSDSAKSSYHNMGGSGTRSHLGIHRRPVNKMMSFHVKGYDSSSKRHIHYETSDEKRSIKHGSSHDKKKKSKNFK